MKKIIALVITATMLLSGCGQPRVITTPDGQTKLYPTYGLANASESRSDKICYELSVGNTVWSILLIQTLVVPFYMAGFSLHNPVRAKPDEGCGIDAL